MSRRDAEQPGTRRQLRQAKSQRASQTGSQEAQRPKHRAEGAEPLLPAPGAQDCDAKELYVPGRAATRVADCLDVVARASDSLLAEAERIIATDAAITPTTLLRFEALLIELRHAAALRAELVGLNTDVWIAGYRVWQRRCIGDEQ